ncbi:MAG: polymorphic toxin-type HINT domain-containing protein [archaeon]
MEFDEPAHSIITSDWILGDFIGTEIGVMCEQYEIVDAYVIRDHGSVHFEMFSDTGRSALLFEGEEIPYMLGNEVLYTVSLGSVSYEGAEFYVNGEHFFLGERDSFRLSDGNWMAVLDIGYVEGHSSVEFIIGGHAIVLEEGSDIDVDRAYIDGLRADFEYTIDESANRFYLEEISFDWRADEERFIASDVDYLKMPFFETFEFVWGGWRGVGVGDESFDIETINNIVDLDSVTVKNGPADLEVLYSDEGSDVWSGIGERPTERLATSNTNELTFYEKKDGFDYDKWFVASWRDEQNAESYLVKAEIYRDSVSERDVAGFFLWGDDGWEQAVCSGMVEGEVCAVGDLTLTIEEIYYEAGGDEWVALSINEGGNFQRLYTGEGLTIHLPVECCGTPEYSCPEIGSVCLGRDDEFSLWFTEENIEGAVGTGEDFYAMFRAMEDDVGLSYFGPPGEIQFYEAGDSGIYEAYVYSPLATKIFWRSNNSLSPAQIIYPGEESLASVYLRGVCECEGGVVSMKMSSESMHPVGLVEFGCGDGSVDDAVEECDDGDDSDTYYLEDSSDADGPCVLDDSYPARSCKLNVCGDGYKYPKGLDGVRGTEDDEECDDGNLVDCDGCSDSCKAEDCGDGKCCPHERGACALDCETCFVAGTKVLVNGIEKNIEDILVGESVVSFGNGLESSGVLQTFVHDVSGYLLINGKLKVTAEHPMMINGAWRKIGEAEVGDVLQTLTGDEKIWNIRKVDERVKVYNLEVAENHNYFAEGYLVHNKPPLVEDEPKGPEN